MTKKSKSLAGLPPETRERLSRLGENIRTARKRRRITLDDMAAGMFVSRKTLSRLESGEPGVSMGVLASALWILGMEQDLVDLARPDKDTVGMNREMQRLPNRVRSDNSTDHLDF